LDHLHALTVRGPFHGISGYDHHVREYVRELHAQGLAVQLVDIPNWHPTKIPESFRDQWFDSLRHHTGARVALHFCMPHQVIQYRNKANVNYTMFEASRVPDSWIEQNLQHNRVIVPTESARSAWLASGMPEERLSVCPLGVNSTLYGTSPMPLEMPMANGIAVATYRIRFLNVSEFGPRKNLAGLLRAWLNATTSQDDAVLILKLSRWGPLADYFPHIVAAAEQESGKTLRDAAPVHFLEAILPDAEMPRLYAAATHYISLSFGEGWDQPMLEAGASGLNLVAPQHSAYSTYLDSSIARFISCRSVPAKYWSDRATAALFEGAEWWEPDPDQAAQIIRSEIDGCSGRNHLARERILANFTWQQATHRLIEILAEVQTEQARRWFF
jgi:glycosyltransferase involved in cell wall biosynthesis